MEFKGVNMKYRLLFVILIIAFSGILRGGEFSTKGLIAAWADGSYNEDVFDKNIGIRAIPEFDYSLPVFGDNSLDFFASFNAYLSSDLGTAYYDLKLYRLKLRYAADQMDIRIGLQKIEFGPAKILRPLRWFDSIDPRDPLKMTDGVYAALFRYFFLNNANIWLWGVYGEDKTRGWERLPSVKGDMEYGGRLQFPLLSGESGLTYHHRTVNLNLLNRFVYQYGEDRYALDGRWDLGVGVWYEAVAKYGHLDLLPYQWQKMITLGTDYTFSVGNGLYVMLEHMLTQLSKDFSGNDEDNNTTALSLMYPIGIFDAVSSITYYDWKENNFYQFLSWQRTYDKFSFNFNLFYYPQGTIESDNNDLHIPKRGYGAQVMVMYNY